MYGWVIRRGSSEAKLILGTCRIETHTANSSFPRRGVKILGVTLLFY